MCTNCLYSKKQQDMEKEISKDTLKNIKKWRKEVLKRDNYICQMCGKPGSNIVHHKVRFRDCYDDKSLVYDVENGVCLCKRCHKIAHGGGNYING